MNGAEEMTPLVPIPRHRLWLLFPRSTQKVYMQLLFTWTHVAICPVLTQQLNICLLWSLYSWWESSDPTPILLLSVHTHNFKKNHPTSPPVPWLCSIFYTLLVAKRPEVAKGMLIMLWLNCPLLKTTHRDFFPRNQLGGSGEQGKLCKGSWGMHWGQEQSQRSGGNTVTCQVTHHWFCRM